MVATGTGEQQNLAFGQYTGSRPTKPAKRPPFNPTAPCEDQAVPNLSAPAHQATGRTVARLNRSQLAEIAEALLEGKHK